MENLVPLIVQLVSGAAGGNIAGSLIPQGSLGSIGNSLVGVLGGGLGGRILVMLGWLAAPELGVDLGDGEPIGTSYSTLLTSVAGGAAGGGLLMSIVAVIKGATGSK